MPIAGRTISMVFPDRGCTMTTSAPPLVVRFYGTSSSSSPILLAASGLSLPPRLNYRQFRWHSVPATFRPFWPREFSFMILPPAPIRPRGRRSSTTRFLWPGLVPRQRRSSILRSTLLPSSRTTCRGLRPTRIRAMPRLIGFPLKEITSWAAGRSRGSRRRIPTASRCSVTPTERFL